MQIFVEQCLDSINALEKHEAEAQIAMCSSLLDTYMRHAGLVLEHAEVDHSEFVMEGDKFWTPEREDGENIFKTIFLFIPRLIYGLAQSIKAAWQQLKLKKMTPEQRLIHELSQLPAADRLVMTVDDPRFTAEYDDKGNAKFFIDSKISSFENCLEYFNKLGLIFEKYRSLIKDNDTVEEAFDEIENAAVDFNTVKFSKNVYDVSMTRIEFDYESFQTELTTFNQGITKITERIGVIMKEVENWYKKHFVKKATIFSSSDYKQHYRAAREFINSMKKTYEAFQKNNAKCIKEVDELKKLYIKIYEASIKNLELVEKMEALSGKKK